MFGSSKETYVGTSVMRAIEDKHVPNSMKVGVFRGVLKNEGIPESILDSINSSVRTTGPKMFRHAKRGNYIYGLPKGRLYSDEVGKQKVIEILENQVVGQSIEVDYARLGPMILDHHVWQYLYNSYDYDFTTNEIKRLSRERGKPIYLSGTQLQLSSDQLQTYIKTVLEPLQNSLGGSAHDAYWMRPRKSIEEIQAGLSDRIKLEIFWYENPETTNKKIEETLYITLPTGIDSNAQYYQVSYRIGDDRYFWTYKAGQGTYPELDDLQGQSKRVFGEFYPFTYMRYGKTKPAVGSEWFKSSKKLMKIIGLDYEQVVEGVHESPDIKDVEQAIIFFAVSPNSNDQVDLEYLYEFFSYLKAEQGTQPTNSELSEIWAKLNLNGSQKYVTEFADSRFKKALRYEGIFEAMKLGSIGEIGTFKRGTGKITEYSHTVEHGEGYTRDVYISKPYFTFSKQITKHIYREIKVYNLEMVYHIWGNHHTTGSVDDSHLLVPIDNTILYRVAEANRERLLSRSIHYVFNSRVTVKLKWYETGFFQFVIQAVTIILSAIAIASGQFQLVYALAMAGMYSALAMVVLEMVVVSLLISTTAKWVVKQVGPELAGIVALVAAVVSFGKNQLGWQINSGSFGELLLKAASTLITAVEQYYSDAMKGLKGDYEALQKEMEEATKLLEETWEMLETNAVLSPLFVIGETPEAYYNRTKYVGQAGMDVIGLTKTFHKRALLLPEVSDTMGDDTNEWITV